MYDVVNGIDDPGGVTKTLINNENVPDHYLSLQYLDCERFLFLR